MRQKSPGSEGLQESQAAARAVSALLEWSDFSRDFDLKGQLSRSSRRAPPLIAEGYGQLTDRHVASYLGARAIGRCRKPSDTSKGPRARGEFAARLVGHGETVEFPLSPWLPTRNSSVFSQPARSRSVAEAIDRDALPAQNECARSEHPRPRKGLRPRPRSIRTARSIVLFQPVADAGT